MSELRPEDVVKLTVPKLRKALEMRGLDTSGLKAALINRLTAVISSAPPSPAATPAETLRLQLARLSTTSQGADVAEQAFKTVQRNTDEAMVAVLDDTLSQGSLLSLLRTHPRVKLLTALLLARHVSMPACKSFAASLMDSGLATILSEQLGDPLQAASVARLLRVLSYTEDSAMKIKIAEAGATVALAAAARSGESARTDALFALNQLTDDKAVAKRVLSEGAHEWLLELIVDGALDDEQLTTTVETFGTILLHDDEEDPTCRHAALAKGAVAALIPLLASPASKLAMWSAMAFVGLLPEGADSMCELGAVPALLELCRLPASELSCRQGALTVSGLAETTAGRDALVVHGGIECMLELLDSEARAGSPGKVSESAAGALWDLSGFEAGAAVFPQGSSKVLLAACRASTSSETSRALLTCLYNRMGHDASLLKTGSLKVVASFITLDSDTPSRLQCDVVQAALNVLTKAIECRARKAILKAGALERAVALLHPFSGDTEQALSTRGCLRPFPDESDNPADATCPYNTILVRAVFFLQCLGMRMQCFGDSADEEDLEAARAMHDAACATYRGQPVFPDHLAEMMRSPDELVAEKAMHFFVIIAKCAGDLAPARHATLSLLKETLLQGPRPSLKTDRATAAAVALSTLARDAQSAEGMVDMMPSIVQLLQKDVDFTELTSHASNEKRAAAAEWAGEDPEEHLRWSCAAMCAMLVAKLSQHRHVASHVLAVTIDPLVALLVLGANSQAAKNADEALIQLLDQEASLHEHAVAALAKRADRERIFYSFGILHGLLQELVMRRLSAADCEQELVAALEAAETVTLPPAVPEVARAQKRLDTKRAEARLAEASRQAEAQRKRKREETDAQRLELGLEGASVPPEFCCPITQVEMVDPVVASDGNSYERAALQKWIDQAHGSQAVSPVTNEPLDGRLIPNRNLRQRIEQHEEELLRDISHALRARGCR